MTCTADIIAELLKDALTAQLTTWSVEANVRRMALPKFDAVEAQDQITIRIAGYAIAETSRIDRDCEVTEKFKIGVGIYKKLKMTDGEADPADFSATNDLTEKIRHWGWKALTQYSTAMSKQANDALYDAPKARAAPASFVSVVDITFYADFEP